MSQLSSGMGIRRARVTWFAVIHGLPLGTGGPYHTPRRRRIAWRRAALARGDAGAVALERALELREPVEHVLVDLVGLLVEVLHLELGLEVDLVLDVGADAVARAL